MINKENEKIFENVKLKISISNFDEKENLEMKKNNRNMFKIATVACCMLVLTTGVVFAKDISEFVKHLFGFNVSEGVDTAVENGFYAEVESNTQSAEGIDVNVESFIVDDYNFAMNFLITLDERYNIEEVYNSSIWFEDLRIIDENNDVVFSTDHHSLHNPNEEFEPEYWNGFSMHTEKISENQLRMYVTSSGSEQTFPRSQKLYISFKRIATRRNPEDGSFLENKNEYRIIYLGDWKFEADVPENMYKRESTSYKAVKCNEIGIDLSNIEAELSNTAFKLNISEIKTDKIDYELLHTRNTKSIYDNIALQKEYVETTNGKKFESASRSDGDGGYGLSPENTIIDYHQTFSLTNYDATDKLTVHIFTNKGEEIIIEFER